jgi:hypothetical protein
MGLRDVCELVACINQQLPTRTSLTTDTHGTFEKSHLGYLTYRYPSSEKYSNVSYSSDCLRGASLTRRLIMSSWEAVRVLTHAQDHMFTPELRREALHAGHPSSRA